MKQPVALLLLSGVLCDALVWSGVTGEGVLPAETIVPDYRDATSLEAMAEQVLAAAPAQFALAGHSMGARVALEVVRRAPERVERLALLNTGVHPVQPGEAEKRRALVALGRERGAEALVDAWLPPMVSPAHRDDPLVMAPLRAMCLRSGVEVFARQAEALLARPDARDLLPLIACPTLVATAREDAWSPVAQHREIAAAIAGSELVVFEGAGHMAPFEAPEEVGAALRRWLN